HWTDNAGRDGDGRNIGDVLTDVDVGCLVIRGLNLGPAQHVDSSLRLQGANQKIERVAGRGEHKAADAVRRRAAHAQVVQALETDDAGAHDRIASQRQAEIAPVI